MANFIELHQKVFLEGVKRLSLPIEKIYKVCEKERGTLILYSNRNISGSLYSAHCVESYDEVMALINDK